MDIRIFYSSNESGLLITSKFEKWQRNMALGVFPVTKFNEIDLAEVKRHTIKTIAFDEVAHLSFECLSEIFSQSAFDSIAFHQTTIDLSGVTINCNHLIVGEKSKIDIQNLYFKNVNEITFLSLKTFKGKVLDKLNSVEKLVIWHDNKKLNDMLPLFPNLKSIQVNHGSATQLNLSANAWLEILSLHLCHKLEKIDLHPTNILKEVVIENCNSLDQSNLGDNVRKWPIF